MYYSSIRWIALTLHIFILFYHQQPNSSDSRIYGAVPAALIVGRAVTRIWPLRGWLKRGYSVRHPPGFPVEGVIVLPAGYQGQTIRKTTSE
jgi:hypothetical protein